MPAAKQAIQMIGRTDGTPSVTIRSSDTQKPDSVYREIREMIVANQLAPGSRIVERDLADLLAVSRTGIRRALHQLQQEGYVTTINRGQRQRLIVAPLTQEDVLELLQLLGTIEAVASQRAAQLPVETRKRLTSQLTKLNDEIAVQGKLKNPDARRIHRIDMAFHRAYLTAGGGPRVLALDDALRPQTDRYGRLYSGAFSDYMSHSVEEHRHIIRAISEGSPPRAMAAVLRHWTRAAERIRVVIERVGSYGRMTRGSSDG